MLKVINLGRMAIVACLFIPDLVSAEVLGTWVTYKSGDDTVKAYLTIPEGKGPFPGLIVIHEWWGLNEWIQETAKELSGGGYVALAVDLYRGEAATSPEVAHELMRGLPEDRAVRDLKAAYSYLRSRPELVNSKIGSLGWCMGGGYSLVAALNIPSLGAAIVCYGRLVTEKSEIKKISCPLMGIFGDQDRGIPPSSVKEFEKAARSLGKQVEVIIYPNVGHAFMNPNNRRGYSELIAKEAWNRILGFLNVNLKVSR